MKVLITGGNGFLGKHVLKEFQGKFELYAPSSQECNLLDKTETSGYVARVKPDVILHMAALCGGIGANKKRPADFIVKNSLMACNIFEAVVENEVPYIYTLGSVCSYPKYCPTPFKEDDLWNGYPEETNAPYGMAKRLQLVMQNAFRDQYGVKGAHLIPVNLFGPHDQFDLTTSHVIPALIRKAVEAKDTLSVWGTGKATREFLYAGDCAKAILRAVESRLDYDKPINIGTGKDISIFDLAHLIAKEVGLACSKKIKVEFSGDESIDGQPKRMLDVSRAADILSFHAQTDLETGLRNTIHWFLNER